MYKLMNDIKVSFRIDSETIAELKELADDWGMNFSQAARQVVKNGIKSTKGQHGSCQEVSDGSSQ